MLRFPLSTVVVLVFLTTMLACGKVDQPASNLELAMSAAKDNRDQLQAVLDHYQSPDDSLKQAAARFLIENMEGHCYATYRLLDTAGNDVAFDVNNYESFEQLLAAVDSIETRTGELDFERGDRVYDLQTITSYYLVENIDLAFRAWREKPWAQFLEFDQFCEYVLPFRGSNEPLDSWRPYYWDRYAGLSDSLGDQADPVPAAVAINNDVRSWFGFDRRYYFHPTDQGHSEMLQSGLGRCEDMTNVTIYALRANGLAVTSDYTPHWANASNNHAWNAILLPGGKVVPFMGAEANPGDYGLANSLAKAYRKTYSQQAENLVFQERKQEKVPRWLGGKNYLDVTSDYVDVADVTVEIATDVPDSIDIAYLCVFNSGEWQAIHWGRIVDGQAAFSDMGTNIVYMAALYLNEEIITEGQPFLLQKDGSVRRLAPASNATVTISLYATTGLRQVASTDGVKISQLAVGSEYELLYFDSGWQSLGTAMATEGPMVFDAVPGQALLWLVPVDSDREEERIFTYQDTVQIWW